MNSIIVEIIPDGGHNTGQFVESINNKNDIKIDFIDSLFNSGKFCGSLVCLDIKMFNMVTSEDDDLRFPQVICDVYTIEKNEKMYVN